ncbi:IclR family transcriptional regulator [Halomarina halobia]|uniref:IclR family transcriptional regulator n=2 Tax=Halomarina halobia TaxID=3033386 RepID=A0ABD6AEK6_9EURY
MSDRVPIKSVRTTFELLEALVTSGGMSLPELSEELAMPRSTVHDYLLSLRNLGYVVKDGMEYRISTRFLAMGQSARGKIGIFGPAKNTVDDLAEKTGEHASLMIEENGLGVLLYIAKGENALDLGVSEGFRMELPTNAPGKAILAHLSTARVEAILDRHGLPKVTEKTVTSREVLYEQLEAIREQGYAIDEGERVEGVRAVAAPIVTGDTVHGALAVSGPAHRLEGTRFETELPDRVLRAANVTQVQYTLGE